MIKRFLHLFGFHFYGEWEKYPYNWEVRVRYCIFCLEEQFKDLYGIIWHDGKFKL